jgi:hypothetical protein
MIRISNIVIHTTYLQVEVTEETYPWWQFMVRLCAVIGGVYATVGMVYNLLSALGCQFSGSSTESVPYSELGNVVGDSYRHKQDPSGGNILTGNATIWSPKKAHLSTPTFETPIVQLVGQGESPKSQLCDIASESNNLNNATSLDSDTDSPNVLPDILSSHTST